MQVQRRRGDFRAGVGNVICPLGPALSSSESRRWPDHVPCGAVPARDQRVRPERELERLGASGSPASAVSAGRADLWRFTDVVRSAPRRASSPSRRCRPPLRSRSQPRERAGSEMRPAARAKSARSRATARNRSNRCSHDRTLIEDVGTAARMSNSNDIRRTRPLRRVLICGWFGVARRPIDPRTSPAGSREPVKCGLAMRIPVLDQATGTPICRPRPRRRTSSFRSPDVTAGDRRVAGSVIDSVRRFLDLARSVAGV